MSNATVTEYKSVAPGDAGTRLPAVHEPYIASENVSFTTATQSSVFQTTTKFVRISAIDACHYAVGTNPTADTGDPYLAAGSSVVIGVPAGQSMRVSLIDA